MNIDTFLKIGHSHTICQDYILSGDDPCPYIILADGCSQAKDSDIGARILCHTALKFLKENQSNLADINPDDMGKHIILNSSVVKSKFYTRFDSLDATLIIAYKVKGHYHIHMYGDGVVYWNLSNGQLHNYTQVEYKPNAPGYLRYRIDGFEKYIDSHVIQCINTLNHDWVVNDPLKPYSMCIHEGDVKDLMIASDGVESFVFKDELLYKTRFNNLKSAIKKSPDDMRIGEFDKYDYGESVFYEAQKELKYLDVCKDMLDFKLTKGTFLKRRVKKVMRDYLKRGLINDDDLSLGCFHEEWDE